MARIDDVLGILKIESLANRKVNELSGGQRQLVSLAQLLTRQAPIMLLDEPTSALDLSRRHEVLSFLRDLAQREDKIIFLAIHDLNDALRYANKVMVLANGVLIAAGETQNVLTEELLACTFNVTARIETCSHGYMHVMVDGIA